MQRMSLFHERTVRPARSLTNSGLKAADTPLTFRREPQQHPVRIRWVRFLDHQTFSHQLLDLAGDEGVAHVKVGRHFADADAAPPSCWAITITILY